MNTRTIFLAMCVMVAFLAVPAMALVQDTTITSQAGGVPAIFSMTMDAQQPLLNLAVGSILADGNVIDVSSNTAYTISGKDTMIDGPNVKPPASAGKMCGVVSASGVWMGTGLTNPIQFTYNGGAYTPLSGSSNTLIYTGAPSVFSGPLKIKQVVTTSDPVLPLDQKYMIHVTITGSAA